MKSNRSAIGARVTARYGGRTQAQEVTGAIELLLRERSPPALRSGRPPSAADLTIRWPNGATEKIPNVEADQLVVIREGSGIERRISFPRARSIA